MRGVFCFLFFGELVVTAAVSAGVGVGAGRCGVGRCSFRASVGAVFILNGMIFSFLDEKRVFKGVV